MVFQVFPSSFSFQKGIDLDQSGTKLKMDFTSSCLRLHPTTENCMAKCVEQQAQTTWNLALISRKNVSHFGNENLIGVKLNFWKREHLTSCVYAQPYAWVCAYKRETESKASLWCSPYFLWTFGSTCWNCWQFVGSVVFPVGFVQYTRGLNTNVVL